MPNIPEVTLNNGLKMPLEGFGVYQITDLAQCKQSILDALSAGYRLIDTAQAYGNESAVGRAIKESPVDRKNIFLTTKVNPVNYNSEKNSYDKTKTSVLESLRKLQTDYIDLILLHDPFGNYYSAYRALEDLYQKGTIKAIGISNFYTDKYIDFANTVKVNPAVNQVETHVFHQRKTLRKYLKKYHTQIEAWSPLASSKNKIFTNSTLVNIGKKYHKSAAQIALKFLAQNQIVIIPKSVHKNRIQENLDIWDFQLTNEDMQNISKLDTGKTLFTDHEDPQSVEKFVNSLKQT